MRLADVPLVFPNLLFVLSLIVAVGPGLIVILIALRIAAVPTTTCIVRSLVITMRHRDYVVAARVQGATDLRIMRIHILPNTLPVSVG